MRTIFALGCALFLAGCGEPTEAEVARVRATLPPGCTVRDLGSYGFVAHLVVVQCDGRRTTTQSYMHRGGKSSSSIAVAQID